MIEALLVDGANHSVTRPSPVLQEQRLEMQRNERVKISL
jgi:hypothetical protein